MTPVEFNNIPLDSLYKGAKPLTVGNVVNYDKNAHLFSRIWRAVVFLFQGKGWIGFRGEKIDHLIANINLKQVQKLCGNAVLVGGPVSESFFKTFPIPRDQLSSITSYLFDHIPGVEEGMFRISAEATETRALVSYLLKNPNTSKPTLRKTPLLCSALKQVWGKTPLINTKERYEKLLQLGKGDSLQKDIRSLLTLLDNDEKQALKKLVNGLALAVQHKKTTKMDWKNLATVWAPSIVDVSKNPSQIKEVITAVQILFSRSKSYLNTV